MTIGIARRTASVIVPRALISAATKTANAKLAVLVAAQASNRIEKPATAASTLLQEMFLPATA
jgi:hypothetical protein